MALTARAWRSKDLHGTRGLVEQRRVEMFPLRDENPSGIRPFLTYSLIGLNVLIFFLQVFTGLDKSAQMAGFTPAQFLSDPAGNSYTILTSMFLHGGIAHIFGNMLYLYIFGDNVEAALGKAGYLVFYLICGIAALFSHTLFNLGSIYPVIGASGAISGILGSYLVLFPNAKIVTLIFYGYFSSVRRIRSLYYLGFWFIYQWIPVLLGEYPGVAYWAHIGGFIVGVLIGLWLRGRRPRKTEQAPTEWEYYPY